MKKFFTTIAAVALLLVSADLLRAQEVHLGIKAGMNVATLGNNTGGGSQYQPRIAYHFGGFARFGFMDKLEFQPELLYSSQGAAINRGNNIQGTASQFVYDYINVPLIFKYYFEDNFFAEAGPQFAYLIRAELTGGNVPQTLENIRNIDAALCFGVGYDFNESIGISVRYNLGLLSTNNDGLNPGGAVGSTQIQDFPNRVLFASLGYTF